MGTNFTKSVYYFTLKVLKMYFVFFQVRYKTLRGRREELLGQKYLAGSIQYWFMVSKTLLKSLEEFVDSFLFLK